MTTVDSNINDYLLTTDLGALIGVLDQIDESLFWIDLSGKIIKANRSAILKTGYSQKELAELKVFDVYDGLTAARWFSHVEALMKRQQSNIKCKLTTKSGKTIPISVKTSLTESGSGTYICAVVKDATNATDEARKMERVLYEYDKLIYRLSHDLRSPISTILGLVNLAQKGSTKDQSEYLKLIEVTLQKQNAMMTNVHHLSAMHATPTQNLDINFPDLINDIITGIPKEREKIDTAWSFQFKLHHFFCNDYYLITKLLAPIIENAVQFSRVGEGESKISILVMSDAHGANIEIQDNGIGIDEVVQDQIFEMFFRGSAYSKGSGLGLYLAKVAADKLDASITFSTNRKGTTFKVFIPSCV